MRKNIVVGNWKMNTEYHQGLELVSEAIHMIKDELIADVQCVFATPYTHLYSIHRHTSSESKFFTAAQNCHQNDSGAYTGEVSAAMIRSVGADYVIIGHSERRQYFNENNNLLSLKIDVALKNNLIPIFCFGELKSERDENKHFELVFSQLKESLFHLSQENFSKIILAYEPVWAIGTGLTASPEQAQEMHSYIRNVIKDQFGEVAANNCSILYGGSCNTQNAKSIFSQPDIDGGLIGGASLKSRDFCTIVTAFNSI